MNSFKKWFLVVRRIEPSLCSLSLGSWLPLTLPDITFSVHLVPDQFTNQNLTLPNLYTIINMASSQFPSSNPKLPGQYESRYNLPNAITSQFIHCDLGDTPCSAQDFFLVYALGRTQEKIGGAEEWI